MRALVAPDSFKGSLSATEAAAAIAEGLRSGWSGLKCELAPLADGGEGTLDVLSANLGGQVRETVAHDALGRSVTARIATLPGGVALVESAEACGLTWLASGERAPERATTEGVGELVRAALALTPAPKKLWVALGGSATADGGIGFLHALGARFFDELGEPLRPGAGGLDVVALLDRVHAVDLGPVAALLGAVELTGLCDVTSPLTGPDGARRYLAQKGAPPALEEALHDGLCNWADVASRAAGRDIDHVRGAGAAGGLGAALLAIGGKLVPGGEAVLSAARVREKVRRADFVIGGEGRVDAQTLAGKAMMGLAAAAREAGRPCFVLAGAVEADEAALREAGIDAALSLAPGPITEEAASTDAARLLRAAAARLSALLGAGTRLLRR